jgi:putative methyltransferase (TIGR04325 family)
MKRQLKALVLSPAAKKLVDRLENAVPLIRKWHRFEYEEHFLRVSKWERLFSGVYPSFAAALAAIPPHRLNSYDNPGSATFMGHRASVRSSDYPVLYWLWRLLPENPKIFDFGGYLGISYYSFENYLNYPPDLEWLICDVPAVAEEGSRLAREKNRTNLSFTTSVDRAAEYPIMLAFGSLQFPERTLADLLRPLSRRPAHLLINKLPLTERETFFTLDSMGPAICPYRVQNEDEFLREMESVGYERVAGWEDPAFGCYIPFYPDHSVRAFSGMYLRQKNAVPKPTDSE